MGMQNLGINDVTEHQNREEELLKTRLRESMGVQAVGIAHDFNNLLTIILGNTALLKRDISPKRRKTVKKLTEIENATRQAGNLTRQLLTIAKGGTPGTRPISITELIYEAVGIVRSTSKARYQVTVSKDILPVEVDPGQTSQVLNNLMLNAHQSMPSGGTILVEAKNVCLEAGHSLPIKDGPYVQVSISDQGVGISPGNLDKIFDPYFTTKDAGSGLGLAICYSIIEKHAGHIEVESKLGVGTTFRIYLPAAIGD